MLYFGHLSLIKEGCMDCYPEICWHGRAQGPLGQVNVPTSKRGKKWVTALRLQHRCNFMLTQPIVQLLKIFVQQDYCQEEKYFLKGILRCHSPLNHRKQAFEPMQQPTGSNHLSCIKIGFLQILTVLFL